MEAPVSNEPGAFRFEKQTSSADTNRPQLMV
jgi:hypothetical protein